MDVNILRKRYGVIQMVVWVYIVMMQVDYHADMNAIKMVRNVPEGMIPVGQSIGMSNKIYLRDFTPV